MWQRPSIPDPLQNPSQSSMQHDSKYLGVGHDCPHQHLLEQLHEQHQQKTHLTFGSLQQPPHWVHGALLLLLLLLQLMLVPSIYPHQPQHWCLVLLQQHWTEHDWHQPEQGCWCWLELREGPPLAWAQGVGAAMGLPGVTGVARGQPHLQLGCGPDWHPVRCAAGLILQQQTLGRPQGSWRVPRRGDASKQTLALCLWVCPWQHWWCESDPGLLLSATACCQEMQKVSPCADPSAPYLAA